MDLHPILTSQPASAPALNGAHLTEGEMSGTRGNNGEGGDLMTTQINIGSGL
ncbi:hypothetical protein GCM10011575_35020 [Microlunatus endophyticus]|uniref:Uncharacterized protein n=1 Tax=Microlunatus endophyticus TaxID=1716077 RepID=A0A917SEG8_9ACTN|nr:hypothetical protein GCM10011575_35020 [Microlunatus endophyticus]